MQIINDVFWIINRGCVITVNDDDDYNIGKEIRIYQDDNLIFTASISGIEMFRAGTEFNIQKPRGLCLRGITKDDVDTKKIKAGMIIK